MKILPMPLAASPGSGSLAPSALSLWQRAGGFAVAFWACAHISQYLSVPVFSYVAMWLPSGLYVGVLLQNPTRTWPWFMLAALLANAAFDLPHGTPILAFVGFYVANTIEALIGAWLMRRWVAERPTLESLREFLGLILFVTGVGTMISALVGGGTLVWFGMQHSFFVAWKTWFLNESLAMLLVTPFILTWFNASPGWKQMFNGRARLIEAVILVAALTSYTWYMLVMDKGIMAPYKSRLMPLLLWAGLRFGLRGITAVNLWFAVWMTFLTTHYQRGLTPEILADGSYVEVLQSFLAMSVLIAFVPTVVLAERDKNLKQMQESESRFRKLFEGTGDALFVYDDQGKILDVNPAACESLGYTREELLRLSVPEIKGNLPPAELDALRKRIRSKASYKAENYHRRRDGSVFPVEVNVTPLETGEHALSVAAVRDITDRKRVEQELLREKSVSDAVINGLPGIFYMYNTKGQLLRWNAEYARVVGGSPADLAAHKWLDCIASDDIEKTRATVERAYAQGQAAVEARVKTTSGPRWFNLVARRLQIGEDLFLIGSGYDITERRQAEARLRQHEAALKQSNDGIALMDLDGRFIFVNDAWARMHGYEKSELLGQPRDIVHTPEQLKDFNALNEMVMKTGHGQREVGHKRKDGSAFPARSSVTLMKDAEGQVTGLLSIASDITSQKQMESQLLRAQRQQTIGTMASGIAHDLNNMLAPLMAGLSLLREEITRNDTRQLLDLMENSIQRGAGIVKQLLIFGRGGVVQRLPMNPVRQILEVAKIIRETFPKNLTLETSCPANLWSISADPNQIYQVLLNLAVNARDAMPSGGILTITAENVHHHAVHGGISPRAGPGDYVLLTVRDTGVGMEPEILDRIFEPFFTTKEIGKGTGLGLSVVIGVVENHGGFVNVQSKVGEGTEFKIYFPALPASTRPKDADASAQLPRGNGELILLVDDEPAILKVVAKNLDRFGYKTMTASSGIEALSVFAGNSRDIKAVISDLSMPAMDGLALCAALVERYPQARVIIATGLGDNLDAAKLKSHGVELLLKKPFTTDALLQGLRQVLSKPA